VLKTKLIMKPLITVFFAFVQDPYFQTPWCTLA